MGKYREFWIDFKIGSKESTHQVCDVSLLPLGHPYKNEKHVIEKGAYDDLLKQTEALAEALEFYSNDNDWGLDWDLVNNPAAIQDKGKHARQAIKEWQKFKEQK